MRGGVAEPVGASMAKGADVLVEQRQEAVERAVVRVEEQLGEDTHLDRSGWPKINAVRARGQTVEGEGTNPWVNGATWYAKWPVRLDQNAAGPAR